MTFSVVHQSNWDTSLQEEDIIEHTNAKCHVFANQYMQEEDNIEHSIGKWHVFTF